MRKLKFYFIYNKGVKPGLADSEVLTVCLNENQIFEFKIKDICLNKYLSHYTNWCELRHYDVNNFSSMAEYVQDVREEEFDSYSVYKLKFKKEGIASIFRMFMGCFPIGCSYEDEKEVDYFMEKLNEVLEEEKKAKESLPQE